MNTIPGDILSRYPILSQRLRNVSKEFEENTLRGVCDLPITNHDIKNVILPLFHHHKQRVIFSRYENGYGTSFQAMIINKFPFDDNRIYRTIVTFYDKPAEEVTGIYQAKQIEQVYYASLSNELDDYIDIYFDILTIRDYYVGISKCKFENYVNNVVN